ncbi:MAG: hypothetical protein WC910_11055, partial [Bacteroidales bacterium]
MAAYNLRYIYLAVFVCLNIVKAYFPDLVPEIGEEILLLPVWCMGATYHVSPLGSNTSPYDTWEKAANLPSTAVSAGNGAAGPHTVKIYPGEYTDSFALGAN